MARIAVIPGDGIGPEVTKESLRVLEALVRRDRLELTWERFDFGADHYLATGVGLPPGQVEKFRRDFDAILFGAVGDTRVPDGAHAREILLGLRFGLDLYVNFRPCRLLSDRLSPLKGKTRRDIDFVVFRENTEGLYGGLGGCFKVGTADEVALAEEIHTRKGVERVVRAAFAWAEANGKRRVALADKANAIPAHGLWRRVFADVARLHPSIQTRALFVDALAMEMVLRPEAFDVIVTTNLFGDILTDLGAALCGGLGLAASANLNPDSTPLFEPVHGSAPDLVGTGRANPLAMLLTVALMLEQLGHLDSASALEAAVKAAVEAQLCTPDLGGELTTREATDAVLAHLGASGK
jgi:3-isopropylmalate dehydrogenase